MPTRTTVTGTQTLTSSASITVSTTMTVTTTIEADSTSVSTSFTTTSSVTATQAVIESCPSQVVANGGFEDGTTTPFVFSNSPNFFDNSGGDSTLLNHAALAHSGSHLASVVETDASLGGLNFRLSQTVTICAGASYILNFYTSSQNNPAGSTQCQSQACNGSVCTSFNPGLGDKPNQLNSIAFPGSAATSVDVVVYTPEIFPGTGITFCGRQFVRFDDFSLTLVS